MHGFLATFSPCGRASRGGGAMLLCAGQSAARRRHCFGYHGIRPLYSTIPPITSCMHSLAATACVAVSFCRHTICCSFSRSEMQDGADKAMNHTAHTSKIAFLFNFVAISVSSTQCRASLPSYPGKVSNHPVPILFGWTRERHTKTEIIFPMTPPPIALSPGIALTFPNTKCGH